MVFIGVDLDQIDKMVPRRVKSAPGAIELNQHFGAETDLLDLECSEAMWKRKVLRSNWPQTTKKQLICLEEIELNHKRIKERAPNDCPLLASLSTDDQSYGASVCDLLSSPMRMMKRIYLKSNFKMIQSHWRHLHYSVPLLSFLIFYHICLVCFLFVRTILHPPGKSGPLSYPLLLDR